MMKSRLDLQTELETILGSNHVYFQPPESIRMKYPCIVYERDGLDVKAADDIKYDMTMRYEVIYIAKDPDCNDFIQKMLESFKYIRYDRHFISDNMNHETFVLYY